MRKDDEKFVSDCRVYQVLKEIATNAKLYKPLFISEGL
jgi:hypothetical protein